MKTLKELIAEGEFLQSQIKYVPAPSGVIRTFDVYKIADNVADRYTLWVENCKRYLFANYKDDDCYPEFRKLEEKVRPDYHRKMVAILCSLHEAESDKPENMVEKVEELEQEMLTTCKQAEAASGDCFPVFQEWFFTSLELFQKFVSDKDADFQFYKNMECRPGLSSRRYIGIYYQNASHYKVLLAKCKGSKPQVDSNISIVVPENAKKLTGEMKIFVSYSHADKKFFNLVDTHLKAFTRQQENRSYWTDKEIGVGDKWKEEIDKALHEANVALLLVSANYLASDFIMNDELPPLLKKASEDGTIIATIIVSPCMFEDSPLASIQAGNLPERTLEEMTKAEQSRTITNLLKELKNRVC